MLTTSGQRTNEHTHHSTLLVSNDGQERSPFVFFQDSNLRTNTTQKT
jgi:hypothetical protein